MNGVPNEGNPPTHSQKVPAIAATILATELQQAMLHDGGLVVTGWRPGTHVSAWLLRVAREEWEWIEQAARAQSAVRTLERLGYTNTGGALWQPPIGASPERRRDVGNALHRVIQSMVERCDRWIAEHPEDAYSALPAVEDLEELEHALRLVDPSHPAAAHPAVVPAAQRGAVT